MLPPSKGGGMMTLEVNLSNHVKNKHLHKTLLDYFKNMFFDLNRNKITSL